MSMPEDAHFNFYRHEYDARMLGMAWAAVRRNWLAAA